MVDGGVRVAGGRCEGLSESQRSVAAGTKRVRRAESFDQSRNKKKLLTHNTERLRCRFRGCVVAATRHREAARNRSGYLTAAAENQ